MKKLVIIPVYNEEKTLSRVLDRIKHFHDGDIVAVDDGSTDRSAQILEESQVRVISHTRNLGYGQSLIDGFNFAIKAKYDLAITIDCDEQHEPCMIPKMFASMGELDVLSGSRYMKESETSDIPPEDRRKINVAITEILNKITGFNLTDSFCGFKCYSVPALAKLSLDEPGYAQPIQFWIQATHLELKVGEMPVPRIYKNLERKFGGELDVPQQRFDYYKRVLQKEVKRWSMSLSSELIQTI